jgi:hypothetical protein
VGLDQPCQYGGGYPGGGDPPNPSVTQVGHDQIARCWIDGNRERVIKPRGRSRSIRNTRSLGACQCGDVAPGHHPNHVVASIRDVQRVATHRYAGSHRESRPAGNGPISEAWRYSRNRRHRASGGKGLERSNR